MITFHATALVALLLDEGSKSQVVVQCSQSMSDPWWKWLVQFLCQLLLSIIPVAGGVWIALWSFQNNSKKENERWARDVEKEHSQWLRDHRKVEWQKLLALASRIEEFMPSVGAGGETIKAVHDPDFNQHLRDATRASMECVFISRSKADAIYTRLVEIRELNEDSKGNIEDFHENPRQHSYLHKPSPLEAAQSVRSELASFWMYARKLAGEDLGVE